MSQLYTLPCLKMDRAEGVARPCPASFLSVFVLFRFAQQWANCSASDTTTLTFVEQGPPNLLVLVTEICFRRKIKIYCLLCFSSFFFIKLSHRMSFLKNTAFCLQQPTNHKHRLLMMFLSSLLPLKGTLFVWYCLSTRNYLLTSMVCIYSETVLSYHAHFPWLIFHFVDFGFYVFQDFWKLTVSIRTLAWAPILVA